MTKDSRTYYEEKTVSLKNGFGKIGPLSCSMHKNGLKWIKDLHIKPKGVKLLEQSTDLPVGPLERILMNLTLKTKATKGKKWTSRTTSIKYFYTAKEMLKKMKR